MKQKFLWLSSVMILLISACSSQNDAQTKVPLTTKKEILIEDRAQTGFASRSDVQHFIEKTHTNTGLNKTWLTETLNKASIKPTIIDAMNRPAERKIWGQYRPIFITEKRIQDGIKFYHQYQNDLMRAENLYGVPASIIVAIIGVETSYGANKGSWSVVDALATLSFEYPRRADYFSKELETFLVIANKMNRDPFYFKGSYAGAMGYPQFMPSSYQAYAIDFDGDGISDLWDNPVDAIGSVANYLSKHGWIRNLPIAEKATIQNPSMVASYVQKGRIYPPRTNLSTLKNLGVQTRLSISHPVQLMRFEYAPNQYEYWVGTRNFYTITRYNASNMYALAVTELAQAIEKSK